VALQEDGDTVPDGRDFRDWNKMASIAYGTALDVKLPHVP